jgi:uncharacterized protein
MHEHTNQLIHEKSPYLLQHAHNPVDWLPWGSAAFDEALREDKPVFLSVGYAACHWCHVMERESFEDQETARLLNEHFVCVKVDREERPDIDGVYMEACHRLTGQGGWPLTIVMTPDKRPFFAATYIPRDSWPNRPGMLDLIPHIGGLWHTRRDDLMNIADNVLDALRREHEASEGSTAHPGTLLGEETLHSALEALQEAYDPEQGGFGLAPKFPLPSRLFYLLRHYQRFGDPLALDMAQTTLEAMHRGGIHDHLGGGIHRYATDRNWLVPHFEKMLYDQALVALASVEAFQVTGRELFREFALDIYSYVLRDLVAPEGGFYSSEDADSQGEEGKYYLFSMDEVRDALGEEAGLAATAFGLQQEGNFADPGAGPITDGKTGLNILHMAHPLPDLARATALSEDVLSTRLDHIRQRLLETRNSRERPGLDDKILTDWNGLMIASLAVGARALGEPSLTQAASRAADFLLATMRQTDVDGHKSLLHRYREKEAAIPAHADDYAFLTWGLIELYQTQFDLRWLETALELTEEFLEQFWDENGGFLFTAQDADDLPVRQKTAQDGPTPSANSVALGNLLRLSRLLGRPDLEEKARNTMQAFAREARNHPEGYLHFLCGAEYAINASAEIILAGGPGAKGMAEMVEALGRAYLPQAAILMSHEALEQQVPFLRGCPVVEGKATAYLCRNKTCEPPITDPEKLLKALGVTDC